eukprot:g8599.t1
MGATFSEDWPTESEILSLIRTKTGVPIQVQDIERDVLTLLSTGLFSRGRPLFARAEDSDAPAFKAKHKEGDLEVQTIPPLGRVDFEMRDRSLPPIISVEVRVDSSLRDYEIDSELLSKIAEETLERSKSGTVSLVCYLKLRKQILTHCKEQGAENAVVVFRGEDKGKTDVIVRARKQSDPILLTGFEEGAEGGYGWGIEPFRPANRPFKLSEKMMIPMKSLQQLTGDDGVINRSPEDLRADDELMESLKSKLSSWRSWTDNETPIIESQEQKSIADYFGEVVTTLYGKLQSDAGRKVGVDPGAAWRAALKSSIQNSVSQIHLFDIPEKVHFIYSWFSCYVLGLQINQKKIAKSIFAGMSSRAALAGAYSLTMIVLSQQDWLPTIIHDSSTWATVVGCVFLLWPVIGPYLEIAQLSAKSADGIEDSVAVKEPIQSDLETPLKLFGEDALLDWPGAMEPVIHQRDSFMARNLYLTAENLGNGAPGYIQDVQDDQVISHLMMPDDGPQRSAPMGTGDGAYFPIHSLRSDNSDPDFNEKKIVAIVGTAHVRGMCREWEKLTNQSVSPSLDEFLLS